MNMKDANNRYDAHLCEVCKELEPQDLPILIFKGRFRCVHIIDRKQSRREKK